VCSLRVCVFVLEDSTSCSRVRARCGVAVTEGCKCIRARVLKVCVLRVKLRVNIVDSSLLVESVSGMALLWAKGYS